MEIIIEEISRGNKVINRYRFKQPKVSIGRGYQNDIILPDPHICPAHIHVDFDGEHWVIHDLETVNGTYISDSKRSANQHVIESGDIISLGNTQLRFMFVDHPVAPSIRFSPFEQLVDVLRHPLAIAFNITIFAIVAGYMFYLNQAAETKMTQYIVRAIGSTLAFAAWPMLVALISHLTKNEARVFAQLGVSFALFNLMWMVDAFDSVLLFNSSNEWVSWIGNLLQIALAFSLFWLNCYIGFSFSTKKRLVVASCLTSLVFGGQYLVSLANKPEFNPRPQYNPIVLSPTFRFVTPTTIEQFTQDNMQLFEKVDKAAKEKKDD
jgi:hypothetical protein